MPSVVSYDPAFAFELAVIVREGIRRMYTDQEAVMFYLTLYNEAYEMPEQPEHVSDADILQGAYCFRRSKLTGERVVNVLASGALMTEALAAAERLERVGVAVNLWSVTSYVELEREALVVLTNNRRAGADDMPLVQRLFADEAGVFVCVSDYMQALAHGIKGYLPGRVELLGTDGFGLSEDRPDLRDHFEVSAEHIVRAAMHALDATGAP